MIYITGGKSKGEQQKEGQFKQGIGAAQDT